MKNSLIIVCDRRLQIYGQELYQSSAYSIEDVARAAGTDQIDLREALLVLGGEIDGQHPLGHEEIREALERAGSCWRQYDEDEEESIEKAVKEASRRQREVFCSFSIAQ